MRYLMLYHPDAATASTPPTPQRMAEMGAFIEESSKSGVLLATGGFAPGTLGTRVRNEKGSMRVLDGPFSETKELIAGFALVEAASKEDAVAYAKRFLGIVGDGESEIYPLMGPPPDAKARP